MFNLLRPNVMLSSCPLPTIKHLPSSTIKAASSEHQRCTTEDILCSSLTSEDKAWVIVSEQAEPRRVGPTFYSRAKACCIGRSSMKQAPLHQICGCATNMEVVQ